MSEFTAAAAERIRNEIRQEFEGLEQKLEDAKNENFCLRKILDDLQQIDALNVQNQRDTKSVGSMDHYLDWLKNLLRGHGQEDDVCDLVNVFLHELDRDELAVANHRGKVEDYEAVRTLFEEHPEFEMSFQSFLEAKMEEEVQQEEQRAIKTHKVLARRMSVVTLTPKSIQMFSMVHKLLECRERADEIAVAEGFLKNRMFEQKSLESFGEPPRQVATDTLDKLIEDATRAKTKLGMVLSEWLRDKLIDPDQIIAEGSKVFTKYPLKSREKCEEKAKTEFSGDYKNVLDIVRCSILVGSEVLLSDLAEALIMGSMNGVRVVRFQNRISNPHFTGVRDVLIHCGVQVGNGKSHIAEIKLQLRPFFELEKECSEVHEYFKNIFKGLPEDRSYQYKASLLDRLRNHDTEAEAAPSGIGFAQELLACDSVGRLAALDELTSTSMLDDRETNLKCRRRLLELAERREACEEVKLKYMDSLSEALALCSRMDELREISKRLYERKKELYGEDHPETKKSLKIKHRNES